MAWAVSASTVSGMSTPVESTDLDWWAVVDAHRERLLRVARRRTLCEQDAEDVVSEAVLRGAERPDLDPDRLPAWLTTVTVRLCADVARDAARERRRWMRADMETTAESCEQRVCDRAEATWLAGHVDSLPDRQAQVLRLRADGLDVTGAAESMGVSYRTAESLLARGRRALRALLTSSLAAFVVMGWRWMRNLGPHGGGGAITTVAGGVALGAAGVAVLVVGAPAEPPTARSGPPESVSTEAPLRPGTAVGGPVTQAPAPAPEPATHAPSAPKPPILQVTPQNTAGIAEHLPGPAELPPIPEVLPHSADDQVRPLSRTAAPTVPSVGIVENALVPPLPLATR